ncbi:response regulator, partial [Paraburkholderia sp. SIMBA_030]|uniref:response regulator n=1 Tax=Paraburkholderia sp. SIMBA_030 TaxID=3085773 RepID=UPI00397D6832
DALAMLDGNRPDLVLSDQGMPGMDGFEFVGKLREMPAMESIICIALSGYGNESDMHEALSAGFNALLKKPVLLDDLLAVVS